MKACLPSQLTNDALMHEFVSLSKDLRARAARRFPAIFPELAEGRLNLTAVLPLAPHLTPENADELLAAAVHKTKPGIELLLAERFPKPDLPTLMRPIAPAVRPDELALEPVVPSTVAISSARMEPLALEQVVPSIESRNAPQVEPLSLRAKLTPLSPDRFALQVTVNGHTNELMLYAQALLGHAVPSGDLPELIERAFEALVEKL